MQKPYERLLALLGLQSQIVTIPRKCCHYLRLDVRNLPRRQVGASLRLQLAQLTGQSRSGFVWRVAEEQAHIWYWDESLPDASREKASVHPWPESLLRPCPPDGLHLQACTEGYEMVAVAAGHLQHTRWLPEMPDEPVWAAFVRDAGENPAVHLRPAPRHTSASSAPPRGWTLFSHRLRPVPLLAWLGAVGLSLAGMALIVGGIYDMRLGEAIAARQAAAATLKRENATTLALQRQITEQENYLETMRQAQPAAVQLLLLQDIAESGLVGGETGVSLAEWEYRSGRLRLLFVVPEDKFNLSNFLAQLQARPIFKEIRLMPDTPPRTVGVQAILVTHAGKQETAEVKAVVKSSATAGL